MIEADKIKAARDQLLLTQEDFARMLEVSLRTVIRWEKGRSAPQGVAVKKLMTLFELLANDKALIELKEVARRTDGPEILRSMVSLQGSTSLDNISTDSARLWSGGGPASGGAAAAGSWGILPSLGALVGGATSVWGAYKILKKIYEGGATTASTSASPTSQFKCAVCGKHERTELLHCTGMLADGQPCTFVVCKGCIYSSKDPHTKLSPTCNCIDIPALEPV